MGAPNIPVTDRNKALLEVITMIEHQLAGGPLRVLEEAAIELAKPVPATCKVAFPSEHYLNPEKLPLPPADFEALQMRIESKSKYVDDLMAEIKPGETTVQGHIESVSREQMLQRASSAIVDLFLHLRYARLHLEPRVAPVPPKV